MRILFLDDDEGRHEAFQRANIGAVIDRAYTADQACQRLEYAEEPYDLVTLDHDLAAEHYADQGAKVGTGQEVASFIAAMLPERRPKKVELHTYNRTGALAMRAILFEAGIVAPWFPFSTTRRVAP